MTETVTARERARDSARDLVVIQRVVLPLASDADTTPLFIDFGAAAGSDGRTVETNKGDAPSSERTYTGSPAEEHGDIIVGRRAVNVPRGQRLSFGTYFNAFPASYWRRWTTLSEVVLRVQVKGSGVVAVYRSSARGAIQRMTSEQVTEGGIAEFTLPLTKFGDGGWYWFDLVGSGKGFALVQADWLAQGPAGHGTATLEITTMNKPEYCLASIDALAGFPDVLERLDEVLIVDQGTTKVQDQPGFEEVAERLKGKLRIINQANLGGSGGFARGMYEAVRNGSTWCLLMDDDIRLEPESLLRLMTFADYTKSPTLVGANMFDLQNRTVLHAFGEAIDRYRWHYVLASGGGDMRHDLAQQNLRNTAWMHRRLDVDYNGWWMELIPTSVIRDIGLALPVFIKWDDAEYGLRAQAAGYPTVTMPGAGVWHESWLDKDDMVGWQSYFHARNRLVTALLHSPYDRGGRVVFETNNLNVKHGISMQYYTVSLRLQALRDLLSGPEVLFDLLPRRIKEIRAAAAEYSDAAVKPTVDEFPRPIQARPPRRGRGFKGPTGVGLLPWAVKTVTSRAFSPVSDQRLRHPQGQLAHMDNTWWRTSQYDSVLVSNAEGNGVSWYRRDPRLFQGQMAESARLVARLVTEWPSLRRRFREAAGWLSSMDAWAETFAEHTDSELTR